MRVGVDEPRHQDAPIRVKDFAVRVNQSFDFATTTDGFYPIIADQHCPVFNDCELAQITTRAGAFRARERDDL